MEGFECLTGERCTVRLDGRVRDGTILDWKPGETGTPGAFRVRIGGIVAMGEKGEDCGVWIPQGAVRLERGILNAKGVTSWWNPIEDMGLNRGKPLEVDEAKDRGIFRFLKRFFRRNKK